MKLHTLPCLVFATWATALAASGPPLPGAVMQELDMIRQKHNISALGLAMVDVSVPVNLAGGLGTLGHGQQDPVTGDTVFRLGSITKSFTSLTLLRLHQEKLLDLDDHLGRFVAVELWQNPWAQTSPITLARLLEHSAGFSDISRAEFDSNIPMPLPQALAKFSALHNTLWRPGAWYSYSNLGAGLAGLAMQEAAGVGYEELVERELLQPLGMKNAGFQPSRVRVVGYDSDGTTVIPYWHVIYPPFGALDASPADMGRFLRWQLERGVVDGQAILTPALMRRSETPRTTAAARAGLEYGDGLGNYTWLREGVLFHGHGGDADGYLSRFGYSHELGKGYFLVINAFNDGVLRGMRAVVERALVDDFKAAAAPANIPVSAQQYPWIAGQYSPRTWRFGGPGKSGQFRVHEGQVQYRRGGGWLRLFVVDAGGDRLLLRYRGQNRATAVLARSTDGQVWFSDGSLNLLRIGSGGGATMHPEYAH